MNILDGIFREIDGFGGLRKNWKVDDVRV